MALDRYPLSFSPFHRAYLLIPTPLLSPAKLSKVTMAAMDGSGSNVHEEPVVWQLTRLFRDKPSPKSVPELETESRFCLVVLNQPLHHPAILRRLWDNCPFLSHTLFPSSLFLSSITLSQFGRSGVRKELTHDPLQLSCVLPLTAGPIAYTRRAPRTETAHSYGFPFRTWLVWERVV